MAVNFSMAQVPTILSCSYQYGLLILHLPEAKEQS